MLIIFDLNVNEVFINHSENLYWLRLTHSIAGFSLLPGNNAFGQPSPVWISGNCLDLIGSLVEWAIWLLWMNCSWDQWVQLQSSYFIVSCRLASLTYCWSLWPYRHQVGLSLCSYLQFLSLLVWELRLGRAYHLSLDTWSSTTWSFISSKNTSTRLTGKQFFSFMTIHLQSLHSSYFPACTHHQSNLGWIPFKALYFLKFQI